MILIPDSTLKHLQTVIQETLLEPTRYRLVEELGRGGMGIVFVAEDQELQRLVALKVLKSSNPAVGLEHRMLQEARIIARLEHPGIVPVHDVGRLPDGRLYYVMKLVRGQRFDQFTSTSIALADRLRVFLRICETVAFAHAHGVLHRDLKPQNVMVGEFGEVLVLDWGLAKFFADFKERADRIPSLRSAGPATSIDSVRDSAEAIIEPATVQGAIVGTLGYMSPEQARGENDRMGACSDIYSLGAILYFLLSGRAPESNSEADGGGSLPQPRRITPPVPKAIEAICHKAMAQEPELRYLQTDELATDVARFLDGLPVSAYPESLFERAVRLASKYPFLIVLVLAYLLTRVLVIFWNRS